MKFEIDRGNCDIAKESKGVAAADGSDAFFASSERLEMKSAYSAKQQYHHVASLVEKARKKPVVIKRNYLPKLHVSEAADISKSISHLCW